MRKHQSALLRRMRQPIAPKIQQGKGALQITRWASLLIAVLFVLGLPTMVRGQDGRPLLQKVWKAYQSLNSYEGVSSVEQSMLYQGKPLRSSANNVEMKWKRPNKISLVFTGPTGMQSVVCDGTNLTVYSASINQYNRIPARPTMNELMLLLGNLGVQARLDPLYFIGATKLPPVLTDLKLKGSASYNGKPVLLLTGTARITKQVFKLKDGRQLVIPASTSNWIWWVNRQTSLLEKIEARENKPITLRVQQGKKVVPRPITATQFMSHVVTSVKPDAPLADKDFVFTPPAGATERKSMDAILKGPTR